MNLRRFGRKYASSIDMTPIIDVVFQLLIFFMLTSTFIKAAAINVELPKSKTSELQPVRQAVITIYKNGNITLNDNLISLDSLGKLIKEEYVKNKDLVVIIQSDKNVPYGLVINVMDIVRLTGVKKLSLSTMLSE
ncbi:MAG: ExbD/TolR family protein [Brevinematia bacterium]